MRIERGWSGVVGNLDCRFIIYKQTTSRGNKKDWPTRYFLEILDALW